MRTSLTSKHIKPDPVVNVSHSHMYGFFARVSENNFLANIVRARPQGVGQWKAPKPKFKSSFPTIAKERSIFRIFLKPKPPNCPQEID